MGLDFSLCPHGLSWGDPGTVGCWTPASPTQLLHEVCKRRGIVQTFKIILRRTPARCSHAVGSVLQHPCSICVFPYTGAGCQAAWDESWGALFLYPILLASHRQAPSSPAPTREHSPKKEKVHNPPEICALASSEPSPSLLSPFLSEKQQPTPPASPLSPLQQLRAWCSPIRKWFEVFPCSPGAWK